VTTRRRSAAILAAAVMTACGLSVPAAAQAMFGIHPSVGFAQSADSNVFSTAHRQADFITQITPMLEVDYRGARLELNARGSAALEHFAQHRDLTTADARQDGGVRIEYRSTPRLVFNGGAEVVRTQTASEFSVQTGLAFARARASRIAVDAAATRGIDPRTDTTVGYSGQHMRIEGAAAVHQDVIRATTERRWSSRLSGTIGYRAERYVFGAENTTGHSSTAHTLTAGLTRVVTERTSISIAAGPRLSGSGAAVDVGALVRFRPKGFEYSLGYLRSQVPVPGVAMPVAAESISAGIGWSPRPDLSLKVAPTLFTTRVSGARATVTRIDVLLEHPIGPALSLNVGFDSTLQRGRLHPATAEAAIVRHSAIVRLVATPSRSRR
jgi:Putative beta-barrel porin 2